MRGRNYTSEGTIDPVKPSAGKDALALLRLLAARLERLSVDSVWARRASGTRRSVLKALEATDLGEPIPTEQLEALIEQSFTLLEKAAHEIPDFAAVRQDQAAANHPKT